jgi:hypothetical protein
LKRSDLSRQIENSLSAGLHFLREHQLPSGEFKSYRSTDPKMREDCEFDSSPFPSAQIAFCLNFFPASTTGEMIRKVIHFFLDEMEGPGIWRYWTAQHHYHKNIPPDLDDVACVSIILQQHAVPFPDNRPLILANRNPQRLFYTWLAPRWSFPRNLSYGRVIMREALKPISLYYFWKLNESKLNDIDGVVNANVLYYLGQSEATAPLIDYLVEIIESNREECCDKWHLSRFNVYYAISRNYYAGVKTLEKIRPEVIRRMTSAAHDDGRIGDNILETALAVCSLLNWNCDSPALHRGIRYLLNTQHSSGEWPIFPYYYGGPKRYFGWGSAELTTGFCLEALVRYLQQYETEVSSPFASKPHQAV